MRPSQAIPARLIQRVLVVFKHSMTGTPIEMHSGLYIPGLRGRKHVSE